VVLKYGLETGISARPRRPRKAFPASGRSKSGLSSIPGPN
jgi:hypothetical protein